MYYTVTVTYVVQEIRLFMSFASGLLPSHRHLARCSHGGRYSGMSVSSNGLEVGGLIPTQYSSNGRTDQYCGGAVGLGGGSHAGQYKYNQQPTPYYEYTSTPSESSRRNTVHARHGRVIRLALLAEETACVTGACHQAADNPHDTAYVATKLGFF